MLILMNTRDGFQPPRLGCGIRSAPRPANIIAANSDELIRKCIEFTHYFQ